ncbi:hypothetical protein PINS_up010616 [Pythium insidiosum]|nr:hypothetical protein PINS_up010616 [Pythium insidiosum]
MFRRLAVLLAVTLLATVALFPTVTEGMISPRAFRHEDLHRAKLAHALARREMMMRQAEERQRRLLNQTDAQPSLFASTGQSIRATLSTIYGFLKGMTNSAATTTPQQHEKTPKLTTEAAEAQVEAAFGARSTASVCIAGTCGLNLIFGMIWVTFSICFAVVFIMDKLRQRKSPSTIKIQEIDNFNERQQSTYYQEVTGVGSSMTLRRRPGKVVQ